ncbi:MAG TPA: class I SAM-dependent methyltransferase [Fibrobacteraceae bacterium]|jgi:ubiquinone/menaquinone biosynthesis C-methylase UbiE|nr:class I SAM-dependent methyltransferase [Fibrobacter sp.]HPW94313.1 class I SAM-dependent methyltransferase [Fibrobacteraceae bacterium]HQB65185.1 class I SAM-dependent methyltransferase [Fibrobacteraceae bacterium]
MTIKEPTQSVWNRFWQQKNDMEKVYPSSPSVFKSIEKHFNLDGMKILEVGAGTGRDSVELARRGAEVYVLDFAENSLKIINSLRIKEGLYDQIHLIRGDAFASPFPDNTFDLVFHQGLAEHFKDPVALLRENYRIIKKGGHCLCDVPQTIHPYTVIKHILIALDRWFAGWETEYTMPQLKGLMTQAGFSIRYTYGDWMRPNLFYRMLRELCFRFNIELPKYPLTGTAYQKLKDQILDALATVPFMHYTQLSIGVLGKK